MDGCRGWELVQVWGCGGLQRYEEMRGLHCPMPYLLSLYQHQRQLQQQQQNQGRESSVCVIHQKEINVVTL